MEIPVGQTLLTIDEAADYLRASRSTIYRMMWRGRLKGYKLGKELRFYLTDLQGLLEEVAVKKGTEEHV